MTRLADTANGADVVFCPLPLLKPRFFYGWRALVFSIACAGGLCFGAALFAGRRMVPFVAFILVLGGLEGLLVSWMSRSEQKARYRRAARHEAGPPAHAAAAFSRIVFDLELARPVISLLHEGPWSWAAFEERWRQAGISRPRALADSCLEPLLGTMERPADLLEPEPILASTPMRLWWVIVMLAGCVFFASRHFMQGHIFLGAGALVFAAMLLVQVPQVRELVPALRSDETAPVAGAGYAETRRGRMWTADDSILLVAAPKASGPLYVRLAGPAGWISWTFMSPSDPDFVRLWQRWMHPQPRPELAD